MLMKVPGLVIRNESLFLFTLSFQSSELLIVPFAIYELHQHQIDKASWT